MKKTFPVEIWKWIEQFFVQFLGIRYAMRGNETGQYPF